MFLKDGKTFQLPTAGYGIGEDGTIYRDGCPSDVDGINYPAGTGPLYSPEGRAALGITDQPVQPRPDERLFNIWQNADGSYSTEPRPRDQVTGPVCELIKAERDRRRFDGGVKVGEHWFLSTSIATGEYNSLILMAAGLPGGTVLRAGWRTMDGAAVDMTPDLVKQILVAGFAQVAAIDDAAEAHKVAMLATENPYAYDYREDWPQTYAEFVAAQQSEG